MSKFPAELLDLVFKKIEWHSGVKYAKLHKADIDDPNPYFHFFVSSKPVILRYDEQNCILSAIGNTKLAHFFYKVNINPFITNNIEEYSNISKYIQNQFKDIVIVEPTIHFGYTVTHFRIKQDQIWLVYNLNNDPDSVEFDIYIEQELLVTDKIQKKQILALRTLLQSCMVEGVELVKDNAGSNYDLPLDINQAYNMSLINPKISNKRNTLAFDSTQSLPTEADFKIIGVVIVYITSLIQNIMVMYNKHLIF